MSMFTGEPPTCNVGIVCTEIPLCCPVLESLSQSVSGIPGTHNQGLWVVRQKDKEVCKTTGKKTSGYGVRFRGH
jgi:hypothetical protein